MRPQPNDHERGCAFTLNGKLPVAMVEQFLAVGTRAQRRAAARRLKGLKKVGSARRPPQDKASLVASPDCST